MRSVNSAARLVPGGHDHAHVLRDPSGRSANLSGALLESIIGVLLYPTENAAGRFRSVSEDLHAERWQGTPTAQHYHSETNKNIKQKHRVVCAVDPCRCLLVSLLGRIPYGGVQT